MSKYAAKWKRASAELEASCAVFGIHGNTGSGRTSLAFTLPGPFAYFHDFETREGVVQAVEASGVEVNEFCFGADFMASDGQVARRDKAREILGQMQANWLDAKNWAKTVILDTEHALYGLVQQWAFGTLTLNYDEFGRPIGKGQANPWTGNRKGQLNWQPVNNMMSSFIMSMRAAQTESGHPNLVLIAKARNERDNEGRVLSTVKRVGWLHSTYHQNFRLLTSYLPQKKEYCTEILKAWYGRQGDLYIDKLGTPREDRAIDLPTIIADCLGPRGENGEVINDSSWVEIYERWGGDI